MSLMTAQNVSKPTRRAMPGAATATLSYAVEETAIGQILVARSAQGVCAILIGTDRDELEVDLAARFPGANLTPDESLVHDDLAKVTHFVDKPADGLDLWLDMRGTDFQRRVWEALRAIPVGTTTTYTEIANWIGLPHAARAVASACAANPLALAIPCHRVVRSDGGLADYRWGVERKRALIAKEMQA
ncbi:methylated-DNA--[protein]-cysteine S-methyltransferase [Sphingomonas oligoaromativorans]|uniref:methylated-DNA--[protein]-cysteine S-methyltransferase n=1 Tax=Sphingomonas oligoaromativorans TaxID=575322 RepID=UPI001423902D|nr:methylated-DNA--[protein]-cysteine S-methyltransferase [Sphingomonas oligoaromativorans]NIJ33784.1 O-6-methylguanine DNA methyltransferase [Sphingomonas oligoaromativorans]